MGACGIAGRKVGGCNGGVVGRKIDGEIACSRRDGLQGQRPDADRGESGSAVGDSIGIAANDGIAHELEAGGVDQIAVAVRNK